MDSFPILKRALCGALTCISPLTFQTVFFFFFLIPTPWIFAATNIPTQAWSRDINAGGYTDGAPIGGFGAGTITWNFAGDFYQGRLNIGSTDFGVDPDCHFYMYQKPQGQSVVYEKLTAATLGSGQATYYALYPKAWVDYHGTLFPCKAKVTQFTPMIPGDYQHSSYPIGVYEWDLTNPTTVSCDVAVMLTWDNSFGGNNASVTTSSDQVGLVLTRSGGNTPSDQSQGEFTLATRSGKDIQVTYQSDSAVANLETAFSTAGSLKNAVGPDSLGAIAFKTTLAPGQEIKIPIVLTWDIPLCRPGKGYLWYREYTRYFDWTGTNSFRIAQEALNHLADWETAIDRWQNGVLAGNYPEWLKTMVFNELYYYVTGGTVWECGAGSNQQVDYKEHMFSSLESYIYALYGTSDVRFYGSWPLALLWPDIDKQEVKQFCDSVINNRGDRPAALGTCAHDFGSFNTIFTEWNAYKYRDTTQWKDLNSKLVLMIYRDWALTGKTDSTFLDYCWPAVMTGMSKVHSECDENGLPYSKGEDQTYDDMGLFGDSAYCGSLFLAACEAAQEMARVQGNNVLANQYQTWFKKGQAYFETKLWNGSYYNIDTASQDTSRIMSDQLAGQWYAKAVGLPGIVPDDHAISAWQKVHDYNWAKFDNGAHGIMNVMTPGGSIDTSFYQSQEMWVGTAWGAVAGMVQEGMDSQAAEEGQSLYNSIWNLGQFWFRTPEAWQTGLAKMRAPYYMRANCVWAVKHAYDLEAEAKKTSTNP